MLIKVYCSSINIKVITITWVYKMGWIFYTLSMTNGWNIIWIVFCVIDVSIVSLNLRYEMCRFFTWVICNVIIIWYLCNYRLISDSSLCKTCVGKIYILIIIVTQSWAVILLGPLVKWDYKASNITGVSYNYNSLKETKKRNTMQKWHVPILHNIQNITRQG